MVEELLAQLRELALALPRPGCDWEDRPHFDPPGSAATLAAIEKMAPFPLPADFRKFLSRTNAVVGMSVHNGYWIGQIDRLSLTDFPRLVGGEPALPIGTDGGGNAFLLAANGHVGRWDHETGTFAEVAPSFETFLERIVADWAAYISDTPD